MLKVPMMRSILLSATLALGACVGGPSIVTANAVGCSQLVPEEWKQGVAGAELPAGNEVGDWITFGDAQTGKLDQANGRTKDAIGIVERCEARDARAVKRAKRGFLGRLFSEAKGRRVLASRGLVDRQTFAARLSADRADLHAAVIGGG